MDTAIVVALISLAGSTVTVVLTGLLSSRQADDSTRLQQRLDEDKRAADEQFERLRQRLQIESRQEERQHDARTRLTTYREPLLDATSELADRLGNIQGGGFLVYVHGATPRREVAVESTLYRLARYFGYLERVYEGVNYLQLEDAEDTREVGRLVKAIERTFASDDLDRDDDDRCETSRFMIWREEQRAMGGSVLVRTEPGSYHIVGFGEFVDRCADGASRWFATFAHDLIEADAEHSRRLAEVGRLLRLLATALDVEARLVEG